MHRAPVPWSGNPADRGTLNHIRREQFQTGVPPTTSTVAPPGYCSDSETDVDAQRFGWTGQRSGGRYQCQSDQRRVHGWNERNAAASVSRPTSAEFNTLGARQHRQLFNGTTPAMSAGAGADVPYATATNRCVVSVASFLSCMGMGSAVTRTFFFLGEAERGLRPLLGPWVIAPVGNLGTRPFRNRRISVKNIVEIYV